jgi:hypothetical protein
MSESAGADEASGADAAGTSPELTGAVLASSVAGAPDVGASLAAPPQAARTKASPMVIAVHRVARLGRIETSGSSATRRVRALTRDTPARGYATAAG